MKGLGNRIRQDVYKVLTALEEVYKAQGCIVPNLGNRNGRRSLEAQVAGLNKHGGARRRRTASDDPVVDS